MSDSFKVRLQKAIIHYGECCQVNAAWDSAGTQVTKESRDAFRITKAWDDVDELLSRYDCANADSQPVLCRDGADMSGTPAARLRFILNELAARFPLAHDQFSSAPSEPKYLAAIDALARNAQDSDSHVRSVILQALQDYLIPENEYNSVEFDAIFPRLSTENLLLTLTERLNAQDRQLEIVRAVLDAALIEACGWRAKVSSAIAALGKE